MGSPVTNKNILLGVSLKHPLIRTIDIDNPVSSASISGPEAGDVQPDAHLPRINKGMVYLGACLIAGIPLAQERQVNLRVVPTGKEIEESVDLAHEICNCAFRKVSERMKEG